MTWQISLTSSFLNSVQRLPKPAQKQFPSVMKTLENDPSPRNGYSIKLDKRNLWRIPVTRKYRLFYQYADNWVKLIEISIRNEGTYNRQRLDKLEVEQICQGIPEWFIEDIEEEETYQYQRISKEELRRYKIDKIYWEQLIEIGKEEDWIKYEDRLIDYIDNHVSKEKQDQILNCCITLDKIEYKPAYIPEDGNSEEFLQEFLEGNKKFSDLVWSLSEEQKNISELPFDKPILVKGGAGTGKTLLAVHKTAQLAKQYHKDGKNYKILFTTYTPALVNYVKQLLVPLLATENLEEDFGVHVYALDELARQYYQSEHGQVPHIIDRNKSKILIKEIYNNLSISNNVRKRLAQIGSAELFLLDEFIYYIEARGINNQDDYRQLRINNQFRRGISDKIWEIYKEWKDRVSYSGYLTVDNLRHQAKKIISQRQHNPPYEALIIDEAQDLSPIALDFLAKLVSSQNNVFLTADINQSLYQRNCGWDHIEASFNNYDLSRKILTRSFRNTEQIGKGCVSILPTHTQEEDKDEITSFSSTQGDKPKIILTDIDQVRTEQIKQFYENNKDRFGLPLSSGVILTPNSEYSQIITSQLTKHFYHAKYINPEDINIRNKFIQVLDLNSIKGLEFAFVVIVGLTQGLFPQYPNNLLPQDKQEVIEQQRKLFYVGCSRAICSLLICGSKTHPSKFLGPLIQDTKYWKTEQI